MTPADFITNWTTSTRNEFAACQDRFIDDFSDSESLTDLFALNQVLTGKAA